MGDFLLVFKLKFLTVTNTPLVHKLFTFNFSKTIDKCKEKVYNNIKEKRKDLI